MPSLHTLTALLACNVLPLAYAAQSAKKVQKLPAMGYDTYNAFAGDYDADLCVAQAQVMKKSGLVAAGYTQFILDDFYIERQRNATGHMVADPTKFPNGIPALSKSMNKLGIKLAAYGDRGYATCGGYPGSYGYEYQDLETWYSWGMTYLKLDNCSKYLCLHKCLLLDKGN